MKARNVTGAQMVEALRNLNESGGYDHNIRFKTFEEKRNGVDFTLTVVSSKEKGARRAHSGNRLAAACWHAHGHYFEEVFKLAPSAVITSSMARITKDEGNWQDRNIGSTFQPMMYSEACDC